MEAPVCHPSPRPSQTGQHPGFPILFSRKRFGETRGNTETKNPPDAGNVSQETHDKSVKHAREVLGAIRMSPRASPTSPGSITPEAIAEQELNTLNPTQPIIAHVVTEQEDHDLVLQKLDAAVASLQQSVMIEAKVQSVMDADDEDNGPSFHVPQNYPMYISCIAFGAGIAVGLKALQRARGGT